jgi:hypothetical protein
MTSMEYPKSEIFVGPRASGKSRRAWELGEEKGQVNIRWTRRIFNNTFLFSRVKPETGLLVIDDVPAKHVRQLMEFLFPEDIIVARQNKCAFKMKRPHTIIIVDGEFEMPKDPSYTRRFSVVKFPEAAPAHWFQEGGVSNVKERPILFSTEMVQALDAGTKTQTRRTTGLDTFNHQPHLWKFERLLLQISTGQVHAFFSTTESEGEYSAIFPYGNRGDLLYVRETFRYCQPYGPESLHYQYKDENFIGGEIDPEECYKISNYDRWRPSIHMPKAAARTWLKITDIRVERLMDLSDADAVAEGIQETEGWSEVIDRPEYKLYGEVFDNGPGTNRCFDPKLSFLSLWTSINGDKSALGNPWVWVVCFEKVENPEITNEK